MRQFSFVVLFVLLAASAQLVEARQTKSGGAKAAAAVTSPVNINTATAAQLQGLPGIGARTAQTIVDHRQKNGPFKKVEELMNIKGIGEKSFLKLKPMVTVGADKPERPTDKQ